MNNECPDVQADLCLCHLHRQEASFLIAQLELNDVAFIYVSSSIMTSVDTFLHSRCILRKHAIAINMQQFLKAVKMIIFR